MRPAVAVRLLSGIHQALRPFVMIPAKLAHADSSADADPCVERELRKQGHSLHTLLERIS